MNLVEPSDGEPKYRVFVSYSRQDRDLVLMIVKILEDNGLKPMWDQDFQHGSGFDDQIKNFIAHAHVFLPVLTKTSDERKWVHHEIGYAMARNIPVLPVAVGMAPGEMIQRLHALRLGEHPEQQLRRHLSREAIAALVQRRSAPKFALYQCAEFGEDRAEMITKYCNDVVDLGVYDLFRQKGALSSLHIPSKTINHPVWKARYGGTDRGPVHCRLQRDERLAVEAHARYAGCKLIVNPYIQYQKWGATARIVRLECFIEFLESMPDSKCQVAFNPDMDHDQSITLLGDWFVAESVSAQIGQGYRQTIFTRHAPSLTGKIEAFDQEFQEMLEMCGWTAENSRAKAISAIREILADLEKGSLEPQGSSI